MHCFLRRGFTLNEHHIFLDTFISWYCKTKQHPIASILLFFLQNSPVVLFRVAILTLVVFIFICLSLKCLTDEWCADIKVCSFHNSFYFKIFYWYISVFRAFLIRYDVRVSLKRNLSSIIRSFYSKASR